MVGLSGSLIRNQSGKYNDADQQFPHEMLM